MENAVDIRNLNKTYKASGRRPETVALSDVSLEIPRGSIFGLLGPNGAGKSTIINIMAGLVTKTSGSVKIWGFDIDVNERNAKVSIGVVPQEINYDAFFTPLETLELQAGLYGVRQNQRKSMEILETVGLADKAHAFVRSLSGGMKRRLLMAKAMVHSPPILVLDEPTAGVDIELRQQLWATVKKLNQEGVTILLTTHYLEEAQQLCEQIAIINHGQVVACEETTKLLSRIDNKEILFRLDKEITAVPESLAGYVTELKNKRVLAVRYSPGEQPVSTMIEKISQAGYRIDDISTEESDLEDVFLQLTSSK
ncbi:MAG: ABC transporter ATP-binding protein [Rhodospirillales bacterium]|nr:ABC transporter ATP-binding protein [Alphaproteobacteria bacterium]MCB1839338.1 ABC transporter ATP-binding protein [Alphaproteobacteria bacterium]MCB9977008.1 ABC transporter ATP-binding protein [Rhodospirillales bacterium]